MTGLLIKTFMFLFPFIKEVFLGKENTNKNKRTKVVIPQNTTLKKAIIVAGCLSVILNIYLLKQTYAISNKNLELTKRLKEIKDTAVIYPVVPTKPITPVQDVIMQKEITMPKPVVKEQPKVKQKQHNPNQTDTNHEKTMDKLNQINKLSLNTERGN